MKTLILSFISAFLAVPLAFAAEFNGPIERAITGYIRPATTEFAESASKLPDAVVRVCSETNEANVLAFQSTYSEVIERFSRVQFLRFGPLLDEDRLSRLAFLPDPRGIAQRQIRKIYAANDSSVLSVETLRNKSVAVQSLTAFELIAFDKDTNILLGAGGDDRDFTCAYALAIAQNTAAISKAVASDWQDPEGYSKLLLSGGVENDRFRSSQEALETIYNALTTGITIAKDQDILPALGTSEQKAKPRRVPFSRSANGLLYLTGELNGIKDAVFSMDLKAELPEENHRALDTLDFEFKNIARNLSALQAPLRRMFSEEGNYSKLNAVSFTLSSVHYLMTNGIAGPLGLAGGFNALDGD
ncbi:imelysin family protein [Roseibium sp. HPY-6]|uniref:imelysin family protein n=1 Tax=Roseibium sp. HPY-6 TaxID=3229852 RepID=UPI0033906F98